jgi:hypothetical protein
MTITRVGSNSQYASGWEAAFGGSKPRKATGKTTGKTATAEKKSAPAGKATAAKATTKKVAAKAAVTKALRSSAN